MHNYSPFFKDVHADNDQTFHLTVALGKYYVSMRSYLKHHCQLNFMALVFEENCNAKEIYLLEVFVTM